ncbi:MAG: peptidase C15 [Actinomycetota bacterium]
MTAKILLTSFDIWKPHHTSNSSDDLLAKFSEFHSLPHSFSFLRKLPVDFEEAPRQAIAKLEEVKPDIFIPCGMAELRSKLTLESTATQGDETLKTPIDLEALLTNLNMTEISHDAGKFVCESLYFSTLKHLASSSLNTFCLFIHVPLLTPENLDSILSDFLLIIERLAKLLEPQRE